METILWSSDLRSIDEQPSSAFSPQGSPCRNQFDTRSVLAVAASACDVPSEDTGHQAGGVDILSVAAQGDQCAIGDVTPGCDAMDDDSEDAISLGDSEEPFTFDVHTSLPHPASSSSSHSPQPSGSFFTRHSMSPLRRSRRVRKT
jgi:hypothetical protein